jgi:hypothetical protein
MSSEAALSAARGGTGVANNAAATLTRSGNHALTLTTTGTTSLTLPTGGTVMSTTSTETITGSAVKTFDSSTTLAVQGLLDMRASDYANIRVPSSALYLYKDDDSQFGYFVASALTATRSWTLPDTSGTVALTGNKLSVFAATTSAELAGVISDETGSGSLVFATSPVLSSPTVRGDLLLQNTSGAQPTLQLSEDPDNGTSKLVMKAAAAMAADYTITWPDAQGAASTVLTNDGSGGLTWGAALTTTLADGKIFVGNGSNVATAVTPSGDVTMSNAGVTAIASGVIIDADVHSSAAISGSKLQAAASGNAGAVDTNSQTFGGRKSAGNSKVIARLAGHMTSVATGSIILFDTEDYDTNSEFDIATNKGRFTPTRAGYYLVTATLSVGGITTDKYVRALIYKNNSVLLAFSAAHLSVNADTALCVSTLVYLNGTTDYINLQIGHDLGAATATVYGGANDTKIQILEVL